MREYFLTSESVSEGHPDKVADQISDAILDEHLKIDPNSRVAAEIMIAKNLVVIGGEITSSANPYYRAIVDDVLESVGYVDGYNGFDSKGYELKLSITKQADDLALSISQSDDQIGAGDQGLMFGYAVRETDTLMPLPISLAHQLLLKLSELRKSGKYDFLLPDAKSQVTVKYSDDKPVGIKNLVISTQHTEMITKNKLQEIII
ncbi:MAG: S-adenosylmethionine synthetase N-terminal domain-containing protein, partial [Ignavibacterium sp.]